MLEHDYPHAYVRLYFCKVDRAGGLPVGREAPGVSRAKYALGRCRPQLPATIPVVAWRSGKAPALMAACRISRRPRLKLNNEHWVAATCRPHYGNAISLPRKLTARHRPGRADRRRCSPRVNIGLEPEQSLTFAAAMPAAVISIARRCGCSGRHNAREQHGATQASAAGTLSSIIFITAGAGHARPLAGLSVLADAVDLRGGRMLGVIFSIPLRQRWS